MENGKHKIEVFHQTILNKLGDDKWDRLIAEKVLCTRHERSRKKIQIRLIPVILATTATFVYLANGQLQKSSHQAKIGHDGAHKIMNNEANISARMIPDIQKANIKAHLIYTVFNRLE